MSGLYRENNSLTEGWQRSEELYRAFQNFHDTHASERREKIRRVMSIHEDFMLEIQSHFQRLRICQYLEYTGSFYEGVKVRKRSYDDDDDIEFDVMMIIDRHKYDLEAMADDRNPGYAWLKLREDHPTSSGLDKALGVWNLFGYFTGKRYVDAEKTVDTFFGVLQKLVNDSEKLKGKVKFQRYGLEVQMDFYPDSGMFLWGPRLYSIDIVPAYVVDGDIYVAKPIKGQEMPNSMTWRRSFSVQEKNKLFGDAKNVLRVLKVVRNREADLAPLTSYHLKTALFYEMDADVDWSERALVQRFLGVLGRLEKSLNSGVLSHYFISNINLLASMSLTNMSNMHDRIKRIRTEKNELMKILEVGLSYAE